MNLLVSRPSSHYILKDTVVFGQGDLSMMMLDSTYCPRKCTMVLTSDSSHFHDSDSSDIMFYGDSFTGANKRYCAGLGAWLAYYTKQPTFTYTRISANNVGPRILLDFLKSHKKSPKVIIWVFTSRFLNDEIESY